MELLDSHHPPPHLNFCMKVKCAGSGSPFECVPLPKITTRDVFINDAFLSSLKTPKSSHILFYDEIVTKSISSLNERHILDNVTKRIFSS